MNVHASSQQDAWQDLIEVSGLKQDSPIKERKFWKKVDLYVDISENIFIYSDIPSPKKERGSVCDSSSSLPQKSRDLIFLSCEKNKGVPFPWVR